MILEPETPYLHVFSRGADITGGYRQNLPRVYICHLCVFAELQSQFPTGIGAGRGIRTPITETSNLHSSPLHLLLEPHSSVILSALRLLLTSCSLARSLLRRFMTRHVLFTASSAEKHELILRRLRRALPIPCCWDTRRYGKCAQKRADSRIQSGKAPSLWLWSKFASIPPHCHSARFAHLRSLSLVFSNAISLVFCSYFFLGLPLLHSLFVLLMYSRGLGAACQPLFELGVNGQTTSSKFKEMKKSSRAMIMTPSVTT